MTRAAISAAALAALLFAAGCSASDSHQADDKSPAGQPSSQAAKSSAEPASPGKMTIRYEDADTPEAQRGRQLMQDAKLLEQVAQQVNDTLNLPYDVGAVGKQCGEANDYWDPNVNEIQLCYEDIQQSERRFANNGNPDPVIAAVDATISGFYHELGHATLGIYELAFTGREEDVADQLSAFMLLAPGADGKPYPNGVRIATDTAQDWKLSAKEAGDANDLPFWDGHSMDITRMYNWECWIYGSDPIANANIVTSGDLPDDRAGNCEDEFQNMSRAWHEMLGPHLKKPS
ncbi:DUF4344 domain-containing metallopeptidase [Mycobacterium riyadhense]|uniref:Metallopeptidase DUF4344 n=1 Tax=Mycobacterium riyadhense TaxID=486698 RepID=A0A1X2B5G2_9MYCO|nr:DUF4344 domain-containing metallopeptidase [Mycobacterium riyadhense]MCV7147572.1 DUF4344 domain-containing metallopeptidase [Mycobacterium riyadhense]ORW58787.1 hypothetical protein AWC22_06315 [Mycobacterium riyadhense]VTP00820.1 hypothetical protein BIN_B_03739 [Mycobacterium riyadhense]